MFVVKVPDKVVYNFLKKKGLDYSSVLDTDVAHLIGDETTQTELTQLNKKYQKWLRKQQEKSPH